MRRMAPATTHSLHDRAPRRMCAPEVPGNCRRKRKTRKTYHNVSTEPLGGRSMTQSRLLQSNVLRKLNKQLQQRNTAEEMSCSKVSDQGAMYALEDELAALEGCVDSVESAFGGRTAGELGRVAAEMREHIERVRGYYRQYSYLCSNSVELKSPSDTISLLDAVTRKYERIRIENEQLKRKLLDGEVAKLNLEQHHQTAEQDLLERKTAEANSLFTDLLVKDENIKQAEAKIKELQALIQTQGRDNRKLRKENARLLCEEKERMDPFRNLGSLKERLRG